MKVVADSSGDYPDGPTIKINMVRFSDTDSKNILFYGYNSIFNQELHEKYKKYKNKILLNLWMPTEFNGDPPVLSGMTDYQPDGKFLDYFDKIYSICPYTIDWINRMTGDNRYKFIWHPFASPEDYGGEKLSYEKTFDICYFGGIHGKYHEEIAQVVWEYGGRISYIYPNQYTTDVGLSHHQKMQMIANSKISVVINQCHLSQNHIYSIKRYKNWNQNEAFAGVDFDIPIIPQYKCRIAEAAYCRSVILVKRDQWNIIENFFDTDEFVYFDDVNDMKEKINHILNHYDEYKTMLDKAYLKTLNMNGKGTFKKIKEIEMFDVSSRKKFVASFPDYFTRGAEVGVSSGDFARNILSVTKNVKLYCVDTWEQNYQLPNPERSYEETFNNLIPFGQDRFELIREGSPNSASRFDDQFFDFVYIDADHHYEPVLDDLRAWYPKVKSGGILFGHDYNQPWEGVVKAVNEFFAEKKYEVNVISAVGYVDGDQDGGSQSWFIIKR